MFKLFKVLKKIVDDIQTIKDNTTLTTNTNFITSSYQIHNQKLMRVGKLGFFIVGLGNNGSDFPITRITAFTINSNVGEIDSMIRCDIQGNSGAGFTNYMDGISCGTFLSGRSIIVDLHRGYKTDVIKSLQLCGIIFLK